jgi:thiol-disulfide isomerase/thioredoxin
MALTLSQMMPLGRVAAEFELLEPLTGQRRQLKELKGNAGTLIMFICNHCPYVKYIQHALVDFAHDYSDKISIIAINSNDAVRYSEDSPEKMIEVAKKLNYPFPYFFDETQEVAKAYGAACTPDFFLFDSNLRLVYRGQFDSARPGNDNPITGYDLKSAVDGLLSGIPITSEQKPSMGCNIKWKLT